MPTESFAGSGVSAGSALAVASGVQIAQSAVEIGSVTSLTGQVVLVRETGERVEAGLGTPVYQNDRVETGSGSGVGLTFADGSSFSLGADGQLVIDSFVYQPGADSSMVMNLAQGAFSFVSGQISKTGENSMSIVTPTATIGIRGTAGAGDENEAVLLQEPGQQLGEMTVTTPGGTVTLAQPNAYTNTANPLAAPTPPVLRPLSEIQNLFGSALRQLPVQLPANENLPPNPDDSGSNEQGEDQGTSDTAQDGTQPAQEGAEEGEEAGEGGDAEAVAEGDGDALGEGEIPENAETDGQADELAQAGPEGGQGNDPAAGPVTLGTIAKIGTLAAPPAVFAPPAIGGPAPVAPKAPAPPAAEPPPAPPVIAAPGGNPVPNTPSITITVESSGPLTLTPGLSEIVQLSGSELSVTVIGQAQSGDSFVDISNSNSQVLTFSTIASHTFSVNGVENVNFGELTSAQTQTIAVGGTGTVIFNTLGGPFNANITGDSGNNTFNIGTSISTDSIVNASMGGGTDTVNVNTSALVTLGLTGVEVVSSTNGASQNVLFSNVVSGVSVNLGAGYDSLTLANGGNSLHLAGVESLTGGTGSDNIAMTESITSGSFFDAGAGGLDRLTLHAGSSNSGTLVNFEFINGVAGSAEHLTLESTVEGTIFDFGNLSDGDSLQLADGGNIVVAKNIATVLGGNGDDAIGFIGASGNVSINGGDGVDSVVNSGSGASFFTLSHVENYIGLDGASDHVTLQTAMQSGDVFFGGGVNDNDTLNLAGGLNTGTIMFFEFVNGTAANDDLALEGPIGLTSVEIDLGGGSDTLSLSDGGNTATIRNVEAVFGGDGVDEITVAGSAGSVLRLGGGGDVATGAAGATDIFIYTHAGDAALGAGETITNFEVGVDLIDISDIAGGFFNFIGGAAFTAYSGSIQGRFADANTLEFDTDDDGLADMEITLSNGVAASLSSEDFVDDVLPS